MIRSVAMRLLPALLLAVVAACGNAPSKDDCTKLLDHLIDLEIKAGGGDGDLSADMKADLQKQRQQVTDFASGQKFIETCTQKTPKKVVDCGLAARTLDDAAKCDEAK